MNRQLPDNTTVTIYLPAVKGNVITENRKTVLNSGNIKFIKFEDGTALIEVGSGDYAFTVR